MSQATFEPFLTAEEAAEQLQKLGIRITAKSLGEKARTKRVPSRKLNGKRCFRMTELLSHYESGEPKSEEG
jgi:hypothetical protein